MEQTQGLLKTYYLPRTCVLKAEKPITGTAASAKDCLTREIILVTGSAGQLHGVPDGLYVYNSQGKPKSSAPDAAVSTDAVSFVSDVDVITFVLRTANFSLVHSRCAPMPGTLYSHTPTKAASRKNDASSLGSTWEMVDYIPLFCIINMESERERSQRLSRVTREASTWDATLREFRDKYKPKMAIPQTPSARSAAQSGGPFSSCTTAEPQEDPNEKVLPPLTFTLDAPLQCEGGPKAVVNAARFFITFQHPEEIKSETPSILSLVLLGHTEKIATTAAASATYACARQMLELEYLVISGVYGKCVRNTDDVIEMVYEKDGHLALCVNVPQWRIVSFVSPASGKGEAVATWTVTLLPVLYCGRFSTLGIVTTRRGHAEDIVAESTPAEGKVGKYIFTNHDILVSVGGDGVAHEICNGVARRNRLETLTLKHHTRAEEKPAAPLSQQARKDAEDPVQQAARKHSQDVWADVPSEDPSGYYEVPDDVLAQTPYVAMVAAGSGCALAKEVEVENFIVSALTILHLRPFTIDIYRMDPFNVPESALKASDARYKVTEADKAAIKLRNSIEGSTEFAKAEETPVRFGMLALMFAVVNEIDKGSEGMRWMGNTRFTVKTMAMIVSGVPLYRLYVRYSSDKFFQPEVRAPQRNQHFGRSFTKEGGVDSCTDWIESPCFRVGFMAINNIRLVARDINFAPYARPSDGFLDSLYVGGSEYDTSDPNYKKKIRRRDAIDFFTQTETGVHVNENSTCYNKCRRLQIIPMDGNVMADGEVMNKTGITVSSVRKAMILLASPGMKWEN